MKIIFISFIIVFDKGNNDLYFYYYNFFLTDNIIKPEAKDFSFRFDNDINMIRCQIISNFSTINCFHSFNNVDFYLTFTPLDIIGKDIGNGESLSFSGTAINQIQLTKSFNNNLFVCALVDTTPNCYIKIYGASGLKEINCIQNSGWHANYKVLYFKETDDFMLISGSQLTTTLLSNSNFEVKICQKNIFSAHYEAYSIIYNNGYQVVNYNNFSNYMTCTNIKTLNEVNDNYYQYLQVLKQINELNINDLDKNQEMIFPFKDMVMTFASTYRQEINENKNVTTINLGNCEIALKKYYNISNESDLYILKVESEQKNTKYPIIEYEVFYPINEGKMEKLNLSICQGNKIELSIPIILNDNIEKYNPNSNYYNDICSKSESENGIDIILNDRRNEYINNNMSLCENNCIFIEYNNINKKAKCSCNVKPILSLDFIELDKDILMNNFLDINKITNIEIMKCYKIVFNKNIINNYGSFILIFIFIFFLVCLFIFYFKSLNKLLKEIDDIIQAKQYIKKK